MVCNNERLNIEEATVYRNLHVRGEADVYKFNKKRGKADIFIFGKSAFLRCLTGLHPDRKPQKAN